MSTYYKPFTLPSKQTFFLYKHQRHLFNQGFLLVLFALLLFLSGCTSTTSVPSNTMQVDMDIPNRWEINGKLGIRSAQQSGSVSIQWRQENQNYRIRIQAPLGQGSAIILGNDQNITIQRAGKSPLQSNDPEGLMLEVFGWAVPIQPFHYWVRGLPYPLQAVSKSSFNANGTLAYLEQSDWTMTYSRYALSEQWLLPGKIVTEFEDTRLTMIIRNWKLQ